MAEILKPDYSFIWASAGAVVTPSTNKQQLGWTVEIPPHQHFNWIDNRQDTALGYIFQRGIPEWDSITEYFAGKSYVQYMGRVYIATESGFNQNPVTAPAYWKEAFVTRDVFDDERVGTMGFALSTNIPARSLILNGAEYSRAVYSKLFAKIGTTWGAGDGSTTFNVPDARGEFFRGLDMGRGVDTGRVMGTGQSHMYASHNHSASTAADGAHQHTGTTSQAGAVTLQGYTSGDASLPDTGLALGPSTQSQPESLASFIAPVPAHTHTFTTTQAPNHTHVVTVTSSGGVETRPRNITVVPFIYF